MMDALCLFNLYMILIGEKKLHLIRVFSVQVGVSERFTSCSYEDRYVCWMKPLQGLVEALLTAFKRREGFQDDLVSSECCSPLLHPCPWSIPSPKRAFFLLQSCSCYFCLSLPVSLRHTASTPFEKTSQTPLKHPKSKNTISAGAAASELLTLFEHHNTWSSKSAHTFSSPLRLHFIQARSNSLMNNGWMDRRLSSTMLLFLSLSLSCGKAIVLMQGNMHWRWAQGPPTQSVCLSAAWRISLTHTISQYYTLPVWSATIPIYIVIS